MNTKDKYMYKAIALALSLVATPALSMERIIEATHQIYNNEAVSCSAVAVSPDTLLTASHCVPASENLSIRHTILDEDLNPISRHIEFVYSVRNIRGNDVSLLKLKNPDVVLTPAPVCPSEDLVIGDEVYAIGFPLGGIKTVTSGLYTGLSKLGLQGLTGNFYRTTIPIAGGSSGGPVIGEVSGEYCVLGLATAIDTRNSFMSYFSTLDAVHEVLEFWTND